MNTSLVLCVGIVVAMTSFRDRPRLSRNWEKWLQEPVSSITLHEI